MKNVMGDLSPEAQALLDQRALIPRSDRRLQPTHYRVGPVPVGDAAEWIVLRSGKAWAGFATIEDANSAAWSWRQDCDAFSGHTVTVVAREDWTERGRP